MADLFRAPGTYWACGSIADSWHGVPVRVPVGLVRAVGLARGGSFLMEDPEGRIETVSGSTLTHALQYRMFCLRRGVDGSRCGFADFADSIGSRSVEVGLRLNILLGSYLSDLFGSSEGSISGRESEILFASMLLASSVRGVVPLRASLLTADGELLVRMTVRLRGVLQEIDVTAGALNG